MGAGAGIEPASPDNDSGELPVCWNLCAILYTHLTVLVAASSSERQGDIC